MEERKRSQRSSLNARNPAKLAPTCEKGGEIRSPEQNFSLHDEDRNRTSQGARKEKCIEVRDKGQFGARQVAMCANFIDHFGQFHLCFIDLRFRLSSLFEKAQLLRNDPTLPTHLV